MPSTQLTNDEEILLTHVRGMVAVAVLAVQEKVPDVEEVHSDAHAAGIVAGKVEILNWVREHVLAVQATLGPYDDVRTCAQLVQAVDDKIREVQAG